MEGRRGVYPPELRERAVRLVAELREHHNSPWRRVTSLSTSLGVLAHATSSAVEPRTVG